MIQHSPEKRVVSLDRGALCISIDLEMGWGLERDTSFARYDLALKMERPVITRLLGLFDKYDFPVTWAVVGAILSRDESLRISSAIGLSEKIWYAPEVVERILQSRPAHETGSHSFRHLNYALSDREAVKEDLDEARKIHQAAGLEFTSFVFPWNGVNHLDLLLENGITSFRSGSSSEIMHRLGRAGRLADKFLPLPPRRVWPVRQENGMVELHGSISLISRDGIRRLIHPGLYLKKFRSGLQQAAESRSLFHLWFHPHNFFYQTEIQLKIMDELLSLAAAMREKGELDIMRMKDFTPPGLAK